MEVGKSQMGMKKEEVEFGEATLGLGCNMMRHVSESLLCSKEHIRHSFRTFPAFHEVYLPDT